MLTDSTGYMSNQNKMIVGTLALAGAITLTLLTGGALAPILIGVLASTASGAGIGYLMNGKQGAIDGAIDGFMWGAILAFGSASLRTLKLLKNGTVVGEGMSNVNSAAKQVNGVTYKGMPGYKIVKFFKGQNYADDLAMAHNARWINRMTSWGVKITDIGIDVTREASKRSAFYAIEFDVVRNYAGTIITYF